MEEILAKLLGSNLLTEETKAQLAEQVQAFKTSLREEVETEVRAELVQQWTVAKDELVEAIDYKLDLSVSEEISELKEDIAYQKKLNEVLVESVDKMITDLVNEEVGELQTDIAHQTKFNDKLVESLDAMMDDIVDREMSELKEDISNFRDLEVEYAAKLAEERKTLAQQVSEELDSLVDQLDEFLEIQISEEMKELKEDIEEARKLAFGQKLFESFKSEFASYFRDEGSVESQLAEAKDQLADAKRQLMEVKRENAVAARRQKLDEVLSPLEGSKREQMEIILNKVPTEKLAETYSRYIGIIMKESVTQQTREVKANKIFTGNAQTPVTGKATQLQEAIEKAKKLAGIL